MGAHYVSDWKNLKNKMVNGCTLCFRLEKLKEQNGEWVHTLDYSTN